MEKIHNLKKRMPLILPQELEMKWLNEKLTKEEVEVMLTPYLEEKMQSHTISKLITSRVESPNVPQVLERFDYPELMNIS
jgi:putative SOS response-associated peptidase YedK